MTGRANWSLTGGLLPEMPGGPGPGFYRMNTAAETPVGSGEGPVRRGVIAFQSICGMPLHMTTGILDAPTNSAGYDLQERMGLDRDMLFGPATMRAAFEPLINSKADLYAVPRYILRGIVATGSEFDPGAADMDGRRVGLCQIDTHPKWGSGQGPELAFIPDLALDYTAKMLRTVFNRTYISSRGISVEMAWDVGIMMQKDPKSAALLRDAREYTEPEYVARVRDSR